MREDEDVLADIAAQLEITPTLKTSDAAKDVWWERTMDLFDECVERGLIEIGERDDW